MNPTRAEHAHDLASAKRAAEHGMDRSLRLLMEARQAGIGQSLALALRTQETGIKGDGNVFGHDPTIFVGAGQVTKAKYLAYKHQRGNHGQGGMQGVGPLQLTYFSFQDRADQLGGCWNVTYNYRVGFRDLAHLIDVHRHMNHPVRVALAVYNGGAVNPNFRYADSVLKHAKWWHDQLTRTQPR
jgi:hypothetical protein